MQQVLRFCNSIMFSLEGRIIIFKTLAISKIVYLGFLTVISNLLIKKLPKKKKKILKKHLYGTPHVQKLLTKHYIASMKMVG